MTRGRRGRSTHAKSSRHDADYQLVSSLSPEARARYENGWPLLALGGIINQMIMTPFVAASTVLLYLDLRVRSEGLDLELEIADVFDRAG